MKIYFYFFRYSLRYKWQLGSAYALVAVLAVFQWLMPLLIGNGIDDALASGLTSRQLMWGGLIVLSSIGSSASGWGETYLIRWVTQKSADDVRNEMARRLLGLSFGYYDRQRTGDLMARVTGDVTHVLLRVVEGTRRVVQVALLMIAVTGVMVATNWRLALIVLLFVVAYVLRSRVGRGRVKQIFSELQSRGEP